MEGADSLSRPFVGSSTAHARLTISAAYSIETRLRSSPEEEEQQRYCKPLKAS